MNIEIYLNTLSTIVDTMKLSSDVTQETNKKNLYLLIETAQSELSLILQALDK